MGMDMREISSYVKEVKLNNDDFYSDDKLIYTRYAKTLIKAIMESGEQGTDFNCINNSCVPLSLWEETIEKKVLQALVNEGVVILNGGIYSLRTGD